MQLLDIVVINDGTHDKSADKSREYVKNYPGTFRQIDKENGGHGSAWNVGLREATEKCVRFLGSDDWFTDFDQFMNELKICDADLIFVAHLGLLLPTTSSLVMQY